MFFSSLFAQNKSMFFEKLSHVFGKKPEKNKKLGIALGSGGAKGMAHIGILRAFEEENINFDVVTGCSIGSIAGGLYARGFSTANMLAALKELKLYEPQSVLYYTLQGVSVAKILDDMLGGADFDELILPFAAVASDIDRGEQVVLSEGNVALAMAASSAIPPVFRAVELGGRRLVDGAYFNNVPADVCKNLGADFVIGVALGTENPENDKIKPALDAIYRNNKIPVTDRAAAGRKNSDVYLAPDLSAYTSASYKNLDDMYEIGYEYAKQKMPEIKAALKKEKIKII